MSRCARCSGREEGAGGSTEPGGASGSAAAAVRFKRRNALQKISFEENHKYCMYFMAR